MSALSGVSQPSVSSRRAPRTAVAGPNPTSEALLVDNTYVRLVRWVFTARLVCLALATPAALDVPTSSPVATIALLLLTVSSLVFSRSDRLIAALIRHPLLASLDTAVSIALLITVGAGQPATLTVVCTALAAGLLFSRRVLVVLMVPLVVGSLGAPATVLSAAPASWQGWLALAAGLPALVLGVCVIGSVVQRNVQSMVEARQQAAEAVAAVGAAQERARLARDMHDSVGKSIHGISLGSKALRRLVDRDPATGEGAGRITGRGSRSGGTRGSGTADVVARGPDRPSDGRGGQRDTATTGRRRRGFRRGWSACAPLMPARWSPSR